MVIPHELILTLKEWKGFGAKNIQATAEYLASVKGEVSGREEYYDILSEVFRSGRLSRLKNMPAASVLKSANAEARRILDTADALGIGIVSRYDQAFPANLLGTLNEDGRPDVPVLLYYKGKLSVTEMPGIAIIGTRNPSPEGTKAGMYLGEAFARTGFNIVSGLALGCDTAAHRGSLAAGNGATTAFLAHGLDSIYPEENTGLAEAVLERGGLLMSEYPAGSYVDRYKLIARDRLQAGLADATLVIQSGVAGGTMHAVRATLKAGKPLYAVSYKGYIDPEKVGGNTRLIQSGDAVPVKAGDICAVIARLSGTPVRPSGPPPSVEPEEPTLFDLG